MTKNNKKVSKKNQLLAAGLIIPALVATVPVEASVVEDQLNETEGAELVTPETPVEGGDITTPETPTEGGDVEPAEPTEGDDIVTPEVPVDGGDVEPTEPTEGEDITTPETPVDGGDVEPTEPTEGEDITTPEVPVDGEDVEPAEPTEGEDITTPEVPTDGEDVEPTEPTEGDDITTPETPVDGGDIDEPTTPVTPEESTDGDVTTGDTSEIITETPTEGGDVVEPVAPEVPVDGGDIDEPTTPVTPEEPTDGDVTTGDTNEIVPETPTEGEDTTTPDVPTTEDVDVTEPVVPTEPTVPVTPIEPTDTTETPKDTVVTETENVQNPDVTLPSEPMNPAPTVVESADLQISFVSKTKTVGTVNVELVEKDGYYSVLIKDDNGLVEVDGKIKVTLKVSEFKYVTKLVDGKVKAVKYKYDAEAGLIVLELDSLDELIHLTSEKKELTDELKQSNYADFIVELYSRNILNVDDIQGFKPNQLMNRQAFISILDTVSDETISDESTETTLTRVEAALLVQELIAKNTNVNVDLFVDDFEDTTELSVDEKTAIGLLKELGIVNGKSATSFDPNTSLTSGQMAKIIANTLAFLETNNK